MKRVMDGQKTVAGFFRQAVICRQFTQMRKRIVRMADDVMFRLHRQQIGDGEGIGLLMLMKSALHID